MKRLLVYPYDSETSCVSRYKDIIKDYELVSIVALKGWGFENKDASIVDGGENIGMNIASSFESEIDRCDTVIFLNARTEVEPDVYLKKIDLAKDKEKEILIDESLGRKLGISNEDKYIKIINNNYQYINMKEKEFYSINTPVIMVYGLGERCNKFDIQLALRKRFLKDGYKVSQVGTKEYSFLFGIHNIPDFIFNDELSFTEKIFEFNYYVHNIEVNENPDVIIVGIPGGILPLRYECNNEFGEIALIISNAISCDIGVLSVYFDNYIDTKYIDKLKAYTYYALKNPTNFINISNVMWEYDKEFRRSKYLTGESIDVEKFISCKFKEGNLNIFNVLNEERFEEIYNNIINELSSGVCIV